MSQVTDPNLIAILNAKAGIGNKTVTDPDLIAELNAKASMQSDKSIKVAQDLFGKSSNPVDQLRSGVYGFGNAGANIARMVNPNAPPMPDIRSNNPENRSPAAESFGQYLPFGVAGGSGLIGSTMAAGAYGASQNPGDRVNGGLQDAALNAVLHGAHLGLGKINQGGNAISAPAFQSYSSQFKPKVTWGNMNNSEFGNTKIPAPSFLEENQPMPLSQNIASHIASDIAGKRTLEESGKQLAAHIENTYKNIRGQHQERYDRIFNSPTENISIHTGEPIKVKDMPIHRYESEYLKSHHADEFKDKNLELSHENYLKNPTIENAHKLQSEYGSEIGYLKGQKSKDLLDSEGKNTLNRYVNAREKLQDDIKNQIEDVSPKLKDEYESVTQGWKNNVIPYHSDKTLRAIAEGKIKNPTSADINRIFKNPEQSISKVAMDLSPDAKDRIIHIGIGKTADENSVENMLSARKSLEKKGLLSYLHPRHEQNFKALRNNVEMEKEAGFKSEMNKNALNNINEEIARYEKERLRNAINSHKNMQNTIREEQKATKQTSKQHYKTHENALNEMLEREQEKQNRIRNLALAAADISLTHGLGGYMAKGINFGIKHLKK